MIFPDVKLEDWVKKHHLKVRKERCSKCGKYSKTDKPFISKEWIGLAAICECGFHAGSTMFARDEKTADMLSTIFWSVEDSSALCNK